MNKHPDTLLQAICSNDKGGVAKRKSQLTKLPTQTAAIPTKTKNKLALLSPKGKLLMFPLKNLLNSAPKIALLTFILMGLVLITNSNIYAQNIAVDDIFVCKFGGLTCGYGPQANDINYEGSIVRDSQTNLHGQFSQLGGYEIRYGPFLSPPTYEPISYGMDILTYHNYAHYGYWDIHVNSNQAKVFLFFIPGDGADNAGAFCPWKKGGVVSNPPVDNAGEPVNVTNGNMWLEQTDYAQSGTGVPINVNRFYNSILQNNGLFGKGWSTQYDESLSVYGDLMIRLNMPDGRAVYLGRLDTSSPYNKSPSGFYGEVVKNQDNTYTLTFKDGRVHKFSSGGKLLWQKDRNGDQTTLAYDTNGNLSSITDAFGKVLTVTTNLGVVTQLSDSVGVVADYVYNTDGTLQSVTRPDGSKYQFEYTTISSKQYLTTVKDALNNVLEAHEYDSQGRATTSEKHGGVEKYTFDYTNTASHIPYTIVTDALNRVTNYHFDPSKGRNLITKIEGNCNCGSGSETTNFTYDQQLNLVKKVDALNRETVYTYDGNGNPLTITDVLGTETYTYNTLGEVLTRTDRMNGVTTNTYDTNGNLLTTTDPLNKTTTLTYNTHGQPATVTDARNKTTTLSYDTSGRLSGVTDANNKATTYGYDARSRVTSITNALNHVTSFEYDSADRLKKVIYPDTNFVTYTYDLAGRRTAVTDERNNATTYGYDNAYRLTSVTDALNHATSFGYDLMSNLTSQTDATGNVTNYEYDNFDRLKKIKYSAASLGATRLEESLTYDAVGNVKTQTDTAGRVTTNNYDTANRLIETIDALNKSTLFTYNARSQMTKVKDALNQEYDFTYDALGRQLTQTRAGSTMSYEYDAVGNRTKRTDYKGQVTDYTFDNLNRLTNITHQMPTPVSTVYTYDDLSRLTNANYGTIPVSFTYDNRNRLTQATDVFNKVLSYTYDASGNRTGLSINNTPHSAYVYDAANRLTTLTDEASQNFSFGYDIANKLISKTLPNGITTTYGYDGMNRLTLLKDQTTSSVLFDRQYAYNTASQINQIAEPSLTRNFAYDLVDRLTQVTNPTNPSESYVYDNVGNRTSSHLSASYTHQSNNKLTATANANYTYDANGNMTSKQEGATTWTYEWDYENRLTSVSNGTTIVEYFYDAFGRKIRRREGVVSTGARISLEKYTYDGMDVVLDDSGTITKYQNGLGIDNKLKLTNGSTAKYFLQDHLGSTNALTDQTGNVIASATYDSFGNSMNTLGTRYQYTGREKDDFSGLTYYRARWYDSNLGRFISEDPIGFTGGDVNLFGYVWNNPQSFTDPIGLNPFKLPANPSQLPSGWSSDKSHQNPNGSRWTSPNGKDRLEFEPGRAGEKGWKGKDHWHKWVPDPNKPGKWVKEKQHLNPGEEVDIQFSACPLPAYKLSQPSLEELRLNEEYYRNMEQFWGKVVVGGVVVGAVLTGGAFGAFGGASGATAATSGAGSGWGLLPALAW